MGRETKTWLFLPLALLSITVGVAQMVERQIVVLNAAGSSPVAHPINEILKLFGYIKFWFGAWRSW